MPAKQVKIRRGTTAEHTIFTGKQGEITVDLDKDTLIIHDESTAGGHPLAKEDMTNVVGQVGLPQLKLSNNGSAGQFLSTDGNGNLLFAIAGGGGGTAVGGDLSGTVSSAQIVSNAISTDKIADDAVTEQKIADDAVTEQKIANDAVGTSQIITGSIVDSKLNTSGTLPAWDGSQLINLPSELSENSVTNFHLADDIITFAELANDAVETLSIKDGNITNVKLADLSVDTDNIIDGNVTTEKLASLSVDGTKIANNAVGITQLSVQTDGNSGDVLSTNGAGVLSFVPISVPTGGIVKHKYVSLTGFHSTNGNYTAPAPDQNVAPLITQGFEFMAMNYTPTDTNNTLRIFTDIWGGSGGGGTVFVFTTWVEDTVTNNVTLINSRGYETAVSQNTGDVTMLGWFKPTTTNQLRISFRLGARNGSQCHINSSSNIDQDYGSGEGGRGESSISVQEYSGQNLGSNITSPGQTG